MPGTRRSGNWPARRSPPSRSTWNTPADSPGASDFLSVVSTGRGQGAARSRVAPLSFAAAACGMHKGLMTDEIRLDRRGVRQPRSSAKENTMLRLAMLFLIIAILAAVFGFTNLAGASMVFAQVIFMVF